jgi:hypothetical protein
MRLAPTVKEMALQLWADKLVPGAQQRRVCWVV